MTLKNISIEALFQLINNYAFANRLPRDQEIRSALNFQLQILDRQKN